jgi:hypothetical protein
MDFTHPVLQKLIPATQMTAVLWTLLFSVKEE